jgi:AraC family transcriptional regulator
VTGPAADRAHGALAASCGLPRLPVSRRAPTGLPQWRLRRAVEYIDAHLSEPVTLADLASSTGLSRMHFAAQFRVATGMRPHEYLLRRRIDRAQQLLREPTATVIDTALSVGFHTQAHFSAVFKRFVGATPRRWRELGCSNG